MNPELSKNYSTERDGLGYHQNYKNLKIYPIRICDIDYLPLFYKLFAYPKKSMDIQNREIFRMTYFKFILNMEALYNRNNDMKVITKYLIFFISFITKTDMDKVKIIKIDVDEKNYSLQLHIEEKVFDETDFDNIREIILQQNGLSIESVEDYSEDLERYLKHHNRFSENYDLNDQILFFASRLQKTVKEIENCTIYQMKNQIKILQDIQHYEMNVIDLAMAGKEYKVPKVFEHLIVPGRYDSILQDVDDFKKNTSYEITQ